MFNNPKPATKQYEMITPTKEQHEANLVTDASLKCLKFKGKCGPKDPSIREALLFLNLQHLTRYEKGPTTPEPTSQRAKQVGKLNRKVVAQTQMSPEWKHMVIWSGLSKITQNIETKRNWVVSRALRSWATILRKRRINSKDDERMLGNCRGAIKCTIWFFWREK